ncbi:MAG: TetR/AcrR family transcriptional regulator [Prevotellaceae bacterium]|nr:TetR/AcrR family transcriptional regulator [Prevotellaceae bacterium]
MEKASKTYTMLVDVARKLFAEMGYANTTMNDIAGASQKGRRTLYTYFKSKEEIYFAVIKQERSRLIHQSEEILKKDISAEQKLIEYIYTRMDTIRDIILRNGSLRAEFFNDLQELEKVRRRLDIQDIRIIKKILAEGVEQQIFDIRDLDLAAMLIHYAMRGLEVPYTKDATRRKLNANRLDVVHFLVKGFRK